MARGGRVRAGGGGGTRPSPGERTAIAAACAAFIADVLKRRFLPAVRPTEFNYPIAIHGEWHGDRYRFLRRYRSDDPRSGEPEFDARFARLDHVSRDLFDLSWHRHTGERVRHFPRVSLAAALHLIETGTYFEPC